MSSSAFFKKIQFPLNTDHLENGLEFVNAVSVSDKFAESTLINATLSQQVEEAQDTLNAVEFELEQVKRRVHRVRRIILSDSFAKVKASMSSEVVDAFIVANAGEHLAELIRLEDLEEDYQNQKKSAKMELDKVWQRMQAFERFMKVATEWVNYDKFHTRLHEARGRGE
jgi:predicted  nucleic acid-binding Zn-ribbon protein